MDNVFENKIVHLQQILYTMLYLIYQELILELDYMYITIFDRNNDHKILVMYFLYFDQ